MDTKEYFEALIDFKENQFIFYTDVIAAEIPFLFKGQSFKICFLNFYFEDKISLKEPKATLQKTQLKVDWLKRKIGFAVSWNEKSQEVIEFSCNKLLVRSVNKISFADMHKAKENLILWRDLFLAWFECITYRDATNRNITVEQANKIECYSISDESSNKKIKFIKSEKDSPIKISVQLSESTNKNTLKLVVKHVSTKEFPPIYYMLLLSALKHLNKKNYRQSIFDSTTALEIVFSKILDTHLKNTAPAIKELILSSHKKSGLMKYVSTLIVLGESLPEHDIKTKLAERRNKAIHEGGNITELMAKEALEITKEIIYKKYPISKYF